MLSRLISLLRRIPAVNWALTRLRPLPHNGILDAAPVVTDASPIAAHVAATAPAPIAVLSTRSMLDEADLADTAPATEDDAAASAVAETSSDEICISDEPLPERPTEIEAHATPPVLVEVSDAPDAAEHEPVPHPAIADDDASPAGISAAIESTPVQEVVVSSADVITGSAEDAVIEAASSDGASADVGPITVDVMLAEAGRLATDVSEASTDSAPAPVVETAPAPANDAQLAVAVAATADDTSSHAVDTEPAPPATSAEIRSVPKGRAKAAEPADRAALIRQRWAETGSRMWNPRLHGTGEAALNIQGSVGLLPPAPGETMPRYDKLEFRMLGGQIVCEGVIVEAPVQASHRSFTRLVEPRPIERTRDPARERQAVLA